jgi:hypothetical protein
MIGWKPISDEKITSLLEVSTLIYAYINEMKKFARRQFVKSIVTVGMLASGPVIEVG